MSLWLSEQLTTGIWKGGLWKSQQGNPYAFNLDLTNFKDSVSGNSLSCIYGGTRYDLVNGVQTAFDSETPVVTEKGLRGVGAYQNLCSKSESFSDWVKATGCTVTYSAIENAYSISLPDVNGDGLMSIYNSVTTSALTPLVFALFAKTNETLNTRQIKVQDGAGSTYTNIVNIPVTISNNYSLYIVTGLRSDIADKGTKFWIRRDLNGCKELLAKYASINNKKYYHPYIKSESSPSASTTEAGTASAGEATNGAYLENVPVNFPKLKSALESKGTLTFDWTPAYDKADVTGELNIMSFDGSTNHLYYDATNGLMKVNDSTNIASVTLNAVANTTYAIKITWETGVGMKVWNGATAGTLATFDGSFNVDGDTIFFLNCVELQYLNNLKLLKTPDWS